MKLSIENHILMQKFGEEKALSLIKDAGFDCVDYSFYWLDDAQKEKVLGERYLEHAHYVRGVLDTMGLTCNQAHAPFAFSAKDGVMDESDARYREVVRSIYAAGIIGAKVIVVHSVDEAERETLLQTNLRYYQSLEKHAAAAGIKIGVENLFRHPYDQETRRYLGNRFGRPETMREIMHELGTEHFAVCVDVGHAAVTGMEPADFIRGMDAELLQALHIQDNNYQEDEHLLPYMGRFPWAKIAQALREIGYTGDLTFEIFGFLARVDEELIVPALAFAESVGRRLIGMIEG